jgi:hypothetical protein
MKSIRLWHTYIACLFVPLTVFFILTGMVQTWNYHKARKDNPYKPPAWLAKICHIHTDQTWPPDNRAERPARGPFRIVASLLGLGMLSTVSLGVIMAYRLAQKGSRITLLLLLGLMIPLAVVLLQH